MVLSLQLKECYLLLANAEFFLTFFVLSLRCFNVWMSGLLSVCNSDLVRR